MLIYFPNFPSFQEVFDEKETNLPCNAEPGRRVEYQEGRRTEIFWPF
jgi:hypothetical protein